MTLRLALYCFGVLIFVGVRLAMSKVADKQDPSRIAEQWAFRRLFLASFLTLFAELAFIRWIAVEVWMFAYFKNLALLLCFLGFGLGCALAKKEIRWKSAVFAFVGLLFVIRLPLLQNMVTEISLYLGATKDTQIWNTAHTLTIAQFFGAALLLLLFFFLLVSLFVPLGQIVSKQMDLAPSVLSAYSWNLIGSLAGILMFLAVSNAMAPPWFWMGLVMIGFAWLQTRSPQRKLVMILVVPILLVLYEPHSQDHQIYWTPYQQIEYSPTRDAQGDYLAGWVMVNHTGYQKIVNLSQAFLALHPGLLSELPEDNPYNLPFRFAKKSPKVLIVGSGTGNDLAGAVRHNSDSVDAIEIDPAVLKLGKSEHPEHPYDSPNVKVYLTDARAFLKRTHEKYDLVLFGLLDSHTQLSDYSNMRIDNFVYTEESFREARNVLKPDGVLFVKFLVIQPWLGQRLATMMRDAFNKPPLVVQARSSYSMNSTCFAISRSDQIEKALLEDPELASFAASHAVDLKYDTVPVTTDDWPYLYQKDREIPKAFLITSVLVLILGIILYLQVPGTRQHPPSPFFFFMGSGFLLLETQVVSRLALYFGTTWQVNGIVIFTLLFSLLLANVAIEWKAIRFSRTFIAAGLFLGLLIAYLFPYSSVPWSASRVGILASCIFAVPVFFAGLLFSTEFGAAASPSNALAANVLGAVFGGLLENLSLIFGMRALLVVCMLLYACAISSLLWSKRIAVGSERTLATLVEES